MADSRDLRRRLNRLGRTKRKKAGKEQHPPISISTVELPGAEVEVSSGRILRIEKRYPLSHRHGFKTLDSFLHMELAAFEHVLDLPPGEDVLPARWFFIDTETTGLAGGAGSFAFLVGAGYFDEEGFLLRQYFMRDPGEEAAMLEALKEDFGEQVGFVTYNGRTFDIPLLEMRYMIGRRERLPLGNWPQMDLLQFVRRLWRRQLPDCRLGTVEQNMMQIERSEADVPGVMIPGMYTHYLQTGEKADMVRVLYHNEIDILSLVVLAAEILKRHSLKDPESLSGSEALGLARWHIKGGRSDQADQAFRQAVQSADLQIKMEALRHHTAQLKRAGRRDEAIVGWKMWHKVEPDSAIPCVELAKHYEWHAGNLKMAKKWTRHAEKAVSEWTADWRKEQVLAEIRHRRERLERKLLIARENE